MRIFGAVSLTRFSSGIFFLKSWRMRIISARIFSKFFGGKIDNFDKGLPLE